jgi:hypothetical protein
MTIDWEAIAKQVGSKGETYSTLTGEGRSR